MRAFLFSLLALLPATDLALAQSKAATKSAPPATETRYFATLDGFIDGADVILKQTRQGKTATSAVLDVCFSPSKDSDRKDRFVVNLTADGQTLTGTSQTLGGKTPVSVNLQQKPNGETFDFKGVVGIGTATYEINSTDNSDLSEKEFEETQAVDDSIAQAPKDFTAVSPEAVGVRVALEAASDFLKTLKTENVEVSLSSLGIGCDALRAGKLVINLSVDPERAASVIAKAKAFPGVTAAGWTNGLVDMDRAILFPAAGWRDGGKLDRAKIAATVTGTLAQTLEAKLATASWDEVTGKLKMTFKRPSETFPALQLTEVISVEALVSADRPGGSDRLMLWLGNPSDTTVDENAPPRLGLNDDASGEEEAEPRSDGGAVAALAKELKGQRWDSESATWQ
ncbi:hypothetical protein BJ123_10795 [Rhodopseudomonas thermotolerans]|uniref:Uncharacterized protein n=2 Tax=Rhodopseudomonas TaxID=1073 RepID=A0A336JLA7_9BRAD|nr:MULTISPECIES: hypothetical protein [Rhodopseudomonas]RED37521.1 hypothetical protein BJ125_10796 [Rhodopseudomonas pentothenatexigens]REG04007.1 hypothetical protein BJ123_10795 [Rhodopseudomonas thermotolerans]SSW90488.1 hypothetical protein SAMN05892882_10796 [Rhodopseudomonas pentothenatexigens]